MPKKEPLVMSRTSYEVIAQNGSGLTVADLRRLLQMVPDSLDWAYVGVSPGRALLENPTLKLLARATVHDQEIEIQF